MASIASRSVCLQCGVDSHIVKIVLSVACQGMDYSILRVASCELGARPESLRAAVYGGDSQQYCYADSQTRRPRVGTSAVGAIGDASGSEKETVLRRGKYWRWR